jgi:hypothetical protein
VIVDCAIYRDGCRETEELSPNRAGDAARDEDGLVWLGVVDHGMNFKHMPELQWRFGYPMVLTVIVVSCYLLYRRFKRAGWL